MRSAFAPTGVVSIMNCEKIMDLLMKVLEISKKLFYNENITIKYRV